MLHAGFRPAFKGPCRRDRCMPPRKLRPLRNTLMRALDMPIAASQLLPVAEGAVLVGLFVYLVQRQTSGNPFLGSRSKAIVGASLMTTRMTDVAGCDAAKEDLQEVIDFLKDPEKYHRLGARIPKGVLLTGPAGTGKTLLAKAVAGEAGVPFFNVSGAEFTEMFIGVGASRARDLFQRAKKVAPSIIFIDEVDAIGRQRVSSVGGGNDERDNTLNQLLIEMDGFGEREQVLVLAATNRPELLDEALVRPGRFDRTVQLDVPDRLAREAILLVHTSNKPLAPDVDMQTLANMTSGFSGADLENLANEAAIYAVRHDLTEIPMAAFDAAFDKLVLGPESSQTVLSDATRRVVAIHEAGHAVAAISVGDFDRVRKISIARRGNAGGVTYFEPDEERADSGLYTQAYLYNQLVVAFGGRAAEEITSGTLAITTGAHEDIRQATAMAKQMVAEYGFNETLGAMNAVDDPDLASNMASDVAAEVRFILEQAYNEAKDRLTENECLLNHIADALLLHGTLDATDLVEILQDISCERPGDDL